MLLQTGPFLALRKNLRFFLLVGGSTLLLVTFPTRADLVINEVCYDNSMLADETGNSGSDWIELYNSGPGPTQMRAGSRRCPPS
jgi:hypothetical protein